jgi:predicted nucleic acid-binding protein
MPTYNLCDYDFKNEKKVILDTNVLISLYDGITAEEIKVAEDYSDFIFLLTEHSIKILLCDIQLSEIFNLIVRRSYQIHKKTHNKNLSYKEYRKTDEYLRCLKDVAYLFNRQLKPVSILDGHCTTYDDLDNFFVQSQVDYVDFYLTEFANKHSVSIITHDRDFLFANTRDTKIYTKLSI